MKARLLGLLVILVAFVLGVFIGGKTVKPQVRTVYYTPSPVLKSLSPTATPSATSTPTKKVSPTVTKKLLPTVPFTRTPTQ